MTLEKLTTQTHRENFLILISVEFHSQIMAGGQVVSLLFSLISLQEYRILTNKVIKKSKLNMYRIQRL